MHEAATKQVNLKLIAPSKKADCVMSGKAVGPNALSVTNAFTRQAKTEGWSYHEIDAVLKEALRRDYDHLFKTLASHCVNGGK